MSKRLLAAASLVALAACNNPASDKAHATVSSAMPTPASTGTGATTTFAITPQNSKIEWTGSKVTGSHDGSFASFSGTIGLGQGSMEMGSVTIDIDTTTLEATPEKLVNHLKSPDFFDVAKFPKARFASTAVKAGGEKGATHTITGNLELHGVTKSVSFPATITVGTAAVDAKAIFTINRKDFGLNYPGKADDLIRDDVVIKLTIHADKKAG
jgi:polyisoprenoid-binding protein YceI